MADIAIFRINYKSDFILTLQSDAGWMTPFCIKFWTGAPSQAYYVGYDGTTYTHCAPVDGDPTRIIVQFDDHNLPIGNLKFQVGYHFTVADFPTTVEDEVINQAAVIIDNDGTPMQVMLDFTGETAPEIQFALPAYANELQRIINEQQRIADEQARINNEETRISNEQTRLDNEAQRIRNEQTRISQEEARVREFATLKNESQEATTAANNAAALANQKAQLAADKAQLAADKAALAQDAATIANEKAQLAADKAELANNAAQLADDKAALAQQKAEYAQAQGDYAKGQGDYAKTEADAARDMLSQIGVFDVSIHNASGDVLATYESLTAALAAVPSEFQIVGLTLKFINYTTSKYEHYRQTSTSWSTAVSDWQGVDAVPMPGSKNLVESGGVHDELYITSIVEEVLTVQAHTDGDKKLFNVSSTTGEISESSAGSHRACELELPSNAYSLTYPAIKFNGNYGYAFLDENDDFISGVKTTTTADITVDLTIPIANGAKKIRFTALYGNVLVPVTLKTINITSKFEKLKDDIEDELNYSKSSVEISKYNGYSDGDNKLFNVSSTTGEFTVSSGGSHRAIEIPLDNTMVSAVFTSYTFSGNFGYAFLSSENDFLSGHKISGETTTVEVTVPISEAYASGARKLRCSIRSGSLNNIPVTINHVYDYTTDEVFSYLFSNINSKPYESGTIRFTFPTKYIYRINVHGDDDVDAIGTEERTGAGLLRLAYNYSEIGHPTKLAIFFSGSGGYNVFSDKNFQTELIPYIDYVCKCGYNVLSPFAWDNTGGGINFSCPYSLANFVKAYNYVIENYNIDRSGVYIWGRSSGGSNVITFMQQSGIHVYAAALQSPQLFSLRAYGKNDISIREKYIRYIFDNDPYYEYTAEYLEQNFYKWASWEPQLEGLISGLSIAQKTALAMAGSLGSDDFNVCLKAPIKIWMPADDTVSIYVARHLFNNVLNSGGVSEFRQMPSNYTDETVLEPNPHHVVDYAGPKSDVTTKLGYDCVEIPNAYIEMVDFFERF